MAMSVSQYLFWTLTNCLFFVFLQVCCFCLINVQIFPTFLHWITFALLSFRCRLRKRTSFISTSRKSILYLSALYSKWLPVACYLGYIYNYNCLQFIYLDTGCGLFFRFTLKKLQGQINVVFYASHFRRF